MLREQALPLGSSPAWPWPSPWSASAVFSGCTGALDGRADPVELLERVGTNAWSRIVRMDPRAGRAAGLALVLGRPRSRAELAFGAIFLTTAVALLLEAGLAGEVEIAQERYVFYVLPLAAITFPRCRRAAGSVVSGARYLTADPPPQVPLAGLTAAEGKTQSPFLLAAFRVEETLGSPGSGSLAVAWRRRSSASLSSSCPRARPWRPLWR